MPEEKIAAEIWEILPGRDVRVWPTPLSKEQRRLPLSKESQQLPPEAKGFQWVEPRYKFEDLLYFIDVNVWHKRCVFLKAAVTGGLGWQLTTDDDDKEPDASHTAINAILMQPNEHPSETFVTIMKRALVDYYATGNAFIEVARNGKGEVAELYHVPARTMRVDADFKGFWQVRAWGGEKQFARWGDQARAGRNEILHLQQYDAKDDYYGIPEWLPALGAMALDREALEYNSYLFQNQFTAKFAVVIEGGTLSRKARNALKNFLQTQAHGLKNSGKALVIAIDDPNVKIRIEKLEVDGKEKDFSFRAGRELSRDEVVAAHGVPPRLVGIMSAGQLGGGGEIEGQLKTFKEVVINPEQESIETYLTRTILASFGTHRWRLKLQEMDITDIQADAAWYKEMLGSGIIDPDEAREELGYPARDQQNGDNLERSIAKSLKMIEQALDD